MAFKGKVSIQNCGKAQLAVSSVMPSLHALVVTGFYSDRQPSKDLEQPAITGQTVKDLNWFVLAAVPGFFFVKCLNALLVVKWHE